MYEQKLRYTIIVWFIQLNWIIKISIKKMCLLLFLNEFIYKRKSYQILQNLKILRVCRTTCKETVDEKSQLEENIEFFFISCAACMYDIHCM